MKLKYFLGLPISLFLTFFVITSASALVVINPVTTIEQGEFDFGGGLLITEIDFEVEGIEADADDTIIGGYVGYGLYNGVSIYGALGYATEDGGGYTMALGAKGALYQKGPLQITCYGHYQYLSEDEDSVEFTFGEFIIGSLATYSPNDQLSLFGGLELIPFSDGEISFSDMEVDVERDGIFNIRAGALYDFGPMYLRGDAAFGSETSFTIALGATF